jgi:hypothetical protein
MTAAADDPTILPLSPVPAANRFLRRCAAALLYSRKVAVKSRDAMGALSFFLVCVCVSPRKKKGSTTLRDRAMLPFFWAGGRLLDVLVQRTGRGHPASSFPVAVIIIMVVGGGGREGIAVRRDSTDTVKL